MPHIVDLRVSAKITGSVSVAADLGNPKKALNVNAILDLVTGTAAGEADLVFADTRTITASSSESLDLAGGLTDAFGASITFAEIVAIVVKPAAGNTNNVLVGGAASNAFATPFGDATDVVKVGPGGVLMLVNDAGYAVTDATGDLLKIANGGSGSSVTYDIVLVGRSA